VTHPVTTTIRSADAQPIIAPEMNLFHRILHTTDLSLHQWLICIVVALVPVAVTEIRKLVLRRRETETPQPAAV